MGPRFEKSGKPVKRGHCQSFTNPAGTGGAFPRPTWRKIFVVPGPESGFAVRGAREDHIEVGRIRYSLCCILHSRIEEIIQTEAWRHLVASAFIGRLQQGIAKAIGEGEVALDAPGIL